MLGIINVYCAQKQNTFRTAYQKCVLCTETEHFPDGTHKTVFTDHKTSLNKEFTDLQSFKYTNTCSSHTTKATHKLHTAGTALCMPFNLCYVHMLVLRIVTDGMRVVNNIKCGVCSFMFATI